MKRHPTGHTGITVHHGKRRDSFLICVSLHGQEIRKTFFGTLEEAVRARVEIMEALAPLRRGRGGYANSYFEPLIVVDSILNSHGPDECVYVGQRRINPVIVKIGYSTFRGVRRRMDGERLHLLLAIPGSRELERSLHQRFDAYQCDVDGREFFFLTKEIRAWIDEEKERVHSVADPIEYHRGNTLAAVA